MSHSVRVTVTVAGACLAEFVVHAVRQDHERAAGDGDSDFRPVRWNFVSPPGGGDDQCEADDHEQCRREARMTLEAAAHGEETEKADRDGEHAMGVLLSGDDLCRNGKDRKENGRRDAMDDAGEGGDSSPLVKKSRALFRTFLNVRHD